MYCKEQKQCLDRHEKFLATKGLTDLVDMSEDAKPLRDFHSPLWGCYIECKTDSRMAATLLIEVRVSIPTSWLPFFTRRGEEFSWEKVAAKVNALPEINPDGRRTLALATAPLESRHLLSYYMEKQDRFFLIDLHQLRQRIGELKPNFMGCGLTGRNRYKICVLPAIADLTDLFI